VRPTSFPKAWVCGTRDNERRTLILIRLKQLILRVEDMFAETGSPSSASIEEGRRLLSRVDLTERYALAADRRLVYTEVSKDHGE
jgi:hypothetical protein